MSENLPSTQMAPTPALQTRLGGQGRIKGMADRQIQIDADIDRIRRSSLGAPIGGMKADGEDGLAIIHPVKFMAAVQLQLRALELGKRVGQEVYELERIRVYLNAMSDLVSRKIAKLAPDVHAELMAELEALNAEYLVVDG